MDAVKTGKFISELRKNKEMTQQQLAALLHVSDKAISRWETGRGFPDINSLEDIAQTLDVSVAELLKGERFHEIITTEDVKDITADGLSLVRQFMNRRKIQNICVGFLLSLILLTLMVVHMTSPIYINQVDHALSIESLSDGRIVAVINEHVAGYEMDHVTDPDTHRVYQFISCYQTRWNQLTGKKSELIAVLGDKDQLDCVYYYPTDGDDQLLYSNDGLSAPEGVISLPRLVYNSWMLMGAVLSLAGITAYILLRKKYYAEKILKIAMFPIAFTISIFAVLSGKFNEVYNAPFYLTGIMLLAILIYALFLTIYYLKSK